MQASLGLYSIANCLEYLNDADAADGVGGVTYEQQRTSKHYTALLQAAEYGQKNTSLTAKVLSSWHDMLCKQDKELAKRVDVDKEVDANDKALVEFVAHVNSQLQQVQGVPSDVKVISLASDILCKFRTLSAFSKTQGRMERLILSYILTTQKRPLIIIRKNELEKFKMLQVDQKALSLFLADKIREKILVRGELYNRISKPSPEKATETYQSRDGEKISVEWHELFQAMQAWQQ